MIRKLAKRVGLIVALIVVILLSAYWSFLHHVHTVIPHRVYRSAQLSAAELQQDLREYHIRSIINLRGADPKAKWYCDETRVARQLGVRHYDIRLNAYHLPNKGKLKQLVHLLETAPKPVLVHCQGGADRSGLASAIALLLQGQPLSAAERQYSLRYFVISKHSVGKQLIPLYEQWLANHHVHSTQQHFLQWLQLSDMRQ